MLGLRQVPKKQYSMLAILSNTAKIVNFAKNSAPQGRKFAEKLRAKVKFVKNCNFAQIGEIHAKIVPRKIAIFFSD